MDKYRLVRRGPQYLHVGDNGATHWGAEKGAAVFDTFEAARLFRAIHADTRDVGIVGPPVFRAADGGNDEASQH